MVQFLHKMFNVPTLLLDNALLKLVFLQKWSCFQMLL